jgi:hypothetical protein
MNKEANKELTIIFIVGTILDTIGWATFFLRPVFFAGALLCAVGGLRWAIHEDAHVLWKIVFGLAIAAAGYSLVGIIVGFLGFLRL